MIRFDSVDHRTAITFNRYSSIQFYLVGDERYRMEYRPFDLSVTSRTWRSAYAPFFKESPNFERYWAMFFVRGLSFNGATSSIRHLTVGVETILIIPLTALPAFWCWRRWWKRRRKNDHTCPACGYDLRASRDACPECGRAIVP